jgi:hypothetical protein
MPPSSGGKETDKLNSPTPTPTYKDYSLWDYYDLRNCPSSPHPRELLHHNEITRKLYVLIPDMTNEWEKEFEEGWARNNPEHPRIAKREAVKRFIQNLLTTHSAHLVERIEKEVERLRWKYSNDLSLDENNLIHKLETLDDIDQAIDIVGKTNGM